jgi:hypothetical protein
MNYISVSKFKEDELHTVFKRSRQTAVALRQPLSQAAFSFHATDVTSAVIGTGDNKRQREKDLPDTRDGSCLLA